MVHGDRGREAIRYLFAGIAAMLAGWGTYAICKLFLDVSDPFKMSVAVVVRFLAAASLAYVLDRRWVFRSRNGAVLREYAGFLGARCATLLVDMAIMAGSAVIGVNDWAATFASQAVVTVLNYVIGKYVVFRSARSEIVEKKEVEL